MNYQVFLGRFEEEDKKKIILVTLDGQPIFLINTFVKGRLRLTTQLSS